MEGFNDQQARAIMQLVQCDGHKALQKHVVRGIVGEWLKSTDSARREELHQLSVVAQRVHDSILQVSASGARE